MMMMMMMMMMMKCTGGLVTSRDSSVGIETRYGLDGPGIESRWGRNFRTGPDRPWGPTSLLYNEYRVFPVGKERPGREPATHPF